MKLRHSAMTATLVAIQAGLCPRGALAEERGCPGVTIETDAGFRGHWPDLLERVKTELSARADLDGCARVDLRVAGDAVVTVSVTLPDGRAAARDVTEPDDVLPTLQALLLVPDPPPPTPAAASAATPVAPQRDAFSHETGHTKRAEPRATTPARPLGVELSLITGARMGDGRLGLGAGALSLLELKGWLIGFEGRADSYRALGGSGHKTALELAILAGRRFDLGGVALDLSAGPGLALMGFDESQSIVQRERPTIRAMPPPLRPSEPRSGPVARLLLGARLAFNPRSVFRTFVGIDGEAGPTLASSDLPSASLPRYSVGFSLGATIGTP